MAFHVDDYEIRWKNYRPFRDTDWIVLRPLTILLGNNNSGKTSVISPLLLMAQTMSSRDTLTPLVTRGSLVDGGTFKDIFHNRDTAEPLFFGLRYHLHDPGSQELKPVGEYPPGAVEVTLALGDNPNEINLTDLALYDIYKRPYLVHHRESDGNYAIDFRVKEKLTPAERNAIATSRPVNFLFSPTSALRNYATSNTGEETPSRSQSSAFNQYIRVVAFAFEQIRDLCRNLAYIGPLREQPRRYYEISGEMPPSVGAHGEHMANVIRTRLADNPKALNKWIRKFEFGEKILIDKLSDSLFTLSFVDRKPSFYTNIAEAGFGASQVLPLIVQALTGAKEKTLTIAEQPEIHLNPRLQAVLADLFVEMVRNDRRVIVETHSEHLLLRLRRLVADGTIDSEMVAIYFVEREGNVSHVRPIEIQKNGHIEQWPKGFFEDSLRETLALASAQARS